MSCQDPTKLYEAFFYLGDMKTLLVSPSIGWFSMVPGIYIPRVFESHHQALPWLFLSNPFNLVGPFNLIGLC
ncbi:hypothetical protein BZA77DRAFT_303878 [Pyronema omphalodes]|nr:hypothetical protein BZA77DRAFT_303878 [Pyronema omphalodes]